MRSLRLAIISPAIFALAALGACGDTTNESNPPTLDTSLQALAGDGNLEVIDVSVPFERLAEAPAQLQAVHRALQESLPGVYVMRYSDDTLRQTLHMFVIGHSQKKYIRMTTAPGESIVQEQSDILGASYDESTESLVLDTRSGVVRLTPQDVTPVGA